MSATIDAGVDTLAIDVVRIICDVNDANGHGIRKLYRKHLQWSHHNHLHDQCNLQTQKMNTCAGSSRVAFYSIRQKKKNVRITCHSITRIFATIHQPTVIASIVLRFTPR